MNQTFTQLARLARAKAAAAKTPLACRAAIADCHDTLKVGGYDHFHPYAKKLWAEIDAYRDRAAALTDLRRT